jgi:hypothetical protein
VEDNAQNLRVGWTRFGNTYRLALRRSVGDAAIPYGFTILNVSAGGVLIRTHGPPTVDAALLFLCGAIAGFAAVELLATAGRGANGMSATTYRRWRGLSSGAAAAAGFGLSAFIAHAIGGPIAFGVVAIAATAVYLGVAALGPALIDLRNAEGARSQPVTRAMAGVQTSLQREES